MDDISTVTSSRGRDGGARRCGPRPDARPVARRPARRPDPPHPDLRRDHRHPAAPVLLRPAADPGRWRDRPGAHADAIAGSPRTLDAEPEPAAHHGIIGIVDQQRAALVPATLAGAARAPAARRAGRRRRHVGRPVTIDGSPPPARDPDAAFDPSSSTYRVPGATGPKPQPQMRRTGPRPIPYSSTPQPLVTLGATNLTYGDLRYWQVTVTLTSNTPKESTPRRSAPS